MLAKIFKASCLLVSAAVFSGAVAAHAEPFGSDEDVRFAERVWETLEEQGLVGPNAIITHPYAGTSRHGPVLEFLERKVTVGDRIDTAIVKRNHRGEGITIASVLDDPTAHLDSIAVMLRRESGYDPDHGDWFWTKFMPDGAIAKTPKGVPMTGRVPACIQCHSAAPGDDYVYAHDRFARPSR